MLDAVRCTILWNARGRANKLHGEEARRQSVLLAEKRRKPTTHNAEEEL